MLLLRVLFLSILIMFSMLSVEESWAGRDKTYSTTIERYDIPDVILLNQNGDKVALRTLLSLNKPVLIEFFYTRCPSISRIISRNLAKFQNAIIAESGDIQLISISIDPEFDTPSMLKAYGKQYQAKPGWDFLTGDREDIKRVLMGFNVYSSNRMRHEPIVLLKSPSDDHWVRIHGILGSDELLAEYERVRK